LSKVYVIHLTLLPIVVFHISLLAEESAKEWNRGHRPKCRVSEKWRLDPLIRSWKRANVDEVIEAESADESRNGREAHGDEVSYNE